MGTKMYEIIAPGSLIRIEFEQPLRGLTISAFEVAVLDVARQDDNNKLVISMKLDPFAKKYGKLMLYKPTKKWTLFIYKRSHEAELIPVRKVTLLD